MAELNGWNPERSEESTYYIGRSSRGACVWLAVRNANELYPIPDMQAETVADIIVKAWVHATDWNSSRIRAGNMKVRCSIKSVHF